MKIIKLFFCSLLFSITISAFGQFPTRFTGNEPFIEHKGFTKAMDTLLFDGFKVAHIDTFQFSFIPPKQFLKVNAQTFVNFQTSSFIQVSEMKRVVYLLAVQNITPEVLEPQGVRLIKTENVMTFNNNKGILVYVENEIEGTTYERMMLFTGDYIRTLWISVTYPKELSHSLHDSFRNSLLSIDF